VTRSIGRREPQPAAASPGILLVGPCDPTCGDYTFLSPPLGVWRLAGVLQAAGVRARVFDPNCCDGPPERELSRALADERPDVVGFSTTGMTLRFDLALAHLARRAAPRATFVAGGMEATFNPEDLLRLGPFDLVVLGEGERPLRGLVERLRSGAKIEGIAGTAFAASGGRVQRLPQPALTRTELRDAIFHTPYERMPYRAYWDRLERAYRVRALPVKADREARLAEIRSVRLMTLNYCPMACTFCSSTNFLNAAQGSVARMGRLDTEECMTMLRRIVDAYPDVRTVIFQDDIFVFSADDRILPLCRAILEDKERGALPRGLRFISTNRIDSMTHERLLAMHRAGFRVLGFGIENFSLAVLREFNKARIHPHIRPVLTDALRIGITPFLDMIMTSPRCSLADLAENIRQAYSWVTAGCEVGMYPYVIPFSGAAMANDPGLRPHTLTTRHQVAGTAIAWDQPSKIPPIDSVVRAAILAIEESFESCLGSLERGAFHLPSRVRSLLWVACSVPVLGAAGEPMPDLEEVLDQLVQRMPGRSGSTRAAIARNLRGASGWTQAIASS
jgi:radical SAM superfamily enzyme YgiQ (UPF0313 family)